MSAVVERRRRRRHGCSCRNAVGRRAVPVELPRAARARGLASRAVSSGSAWSLPSRCSMPCTTQQRELVVERAGVLGRVARRRPPGRSTTSPSSSGMSSGSGGGAVRARASARPGDRRRPASSSIGNASTSVGPVVAQEPLVQLGDRRLVDEQHRQLGVAAHALGVEHALGQRAASGRRRPGRSSCSSATNTSSSPSSPTRRRVGGRGAIAAVTARVEPLVGGALVGVDDVLRRCGGARRRGSVRCTNAEAVDAVEHPLEADAGRCGRRARRPG